jgi:RNA polymerase sigma-70 factor (ECF subfamily)
MNGSISDGVDGEIRAALVRGDESAAVTRAIEGYGPEVLGFLVAVLRDDDAADDVFSMFCEDVWRGLTHVRSANALRAWVYTVARHAAARYRRAAYESRRKPLSCAPLAVLEARARTRTQTFLRSETRSAVDRLREQLAPDERALLILRLDRGLPWNEIAAIMADENSSSADGFRKDAAAWRKRFERVKDRLRKMAESAGLLRDDE